jgi:hypothetical protein
VDSARIAEVSATLAILDGATATESRRVLDTVDELADCVVEDAARVVESLAFRTVGAGFAGGNNSCVTAMTTSDRNSARKKRLSIMEPDHSHRYEKGDSEEVV